MASLRHLRRRSCEGKIRYPDRDAAGRAAAHLRWIRGDRSYHAYRCGFCRGWHVGRKPR